MNMKESLVLVDTASCNSIDDVVKEIRDAQLETGNRVILEVDFQDSPIITESEWRNILYEMHPLYDYIHFVYFKHYDTAAVMNMFYVADTNKLPIITGIYPHSLQEFKNLLRMIARYGWRLEIGNPNIVTGVHNGRAPYTTEWVTNIHRDCDMDDVAKHIYGMIRKNMYRQQFSITFID